MELLPLRGERVRQLGRALAPHGGLRGALGHGAADGLAAGELGKRGSHIQDGGRDVR